MEKERIIFMGTPAFAAFVLERLVRESVPIIAIVSQPDKPVGRKRELQFTPVKKIAVQHQIPVLQPKSLKNAISTITDLNPTLIITCAYGQMLPEEILNYPRNGCINVHASLLPKLRGGAPIHKAIMYGEEETGITIMKMAKKMDSGDIYLQKSIPIAIDDIMGDLHDKLKELAADLLISALADIISGKAVFTSQEEEKATYAYNVSKDEEFVSFQRPYMEVYNHVRSLIPVPVGYAMLEGEKYKLHGVSLSDESTTGADGEVLGFTNNALAVALAGKVLYITEIQSEGKQKVSAKDFCNGKGKEILGKRFL